MKNTGIKPERKEENSAASLSLVSFNERAYTTNMIRDADMFMTSLPAIGIGIKKLKNAIR
jgi:hypothetical protein